MIFKTPEQLFSEQEQFSPSFREEFIPTENKENKYDLFWHVPAFLEENKDNLRLTQITSSRDDEDDFDEDDDEKAVGEGDTFRLQRLSNVTEYINNIVFPEFDNKVENLWVGDPKRDELIEKAEQLLVRCQYNMGYGQSGLYLDYNKLFEILDNETPISVAEKVIDNNLFLSNMATFYSICVQDGLGEEACSKAKSAYTQTLKLMSNSDVHFNLPKENRITFRYEDEEMGTFMKFYEEGSQDDLLVGFGPQFLYDAKFIKNQELQKVEEARKIPVQLEIKNLKEQMTNLQEESMIELQSKKNLKTF